MDVQNSRDDKSVSNFLYRSTFERISTCLVVWANKKALLVTFTAFVFARVTLVTLYDADTTQEMTNLFVCLKYVSFNVLPFSAQGWKITCHEMKDKYVHDKMSQCHRVGNVWCCKYLFWKEMMHFHQFLKIAFKLDFSTLRSWRTPPIWQLQRSLTEMLCTLQYSETHCPQVDFLFTRWSPLPQYTIILIYSLLWWCTGDWELKLNYIRSMLMGNTSLLYQLTNKYLWPHLGVEYTVSYFNHAHRRYIVQHDCLEKC